jgi:hypothetical protein
MTPETNSTTFVLATTLQTENHPIVDWSYSSLEKLLICVTSSELHSREVVQCSAKDFSTFRRVNMPSNPQKIARKAISDFL